MMPQKPQSKQSLMQQPTHLVRQTVISAARTDKQQARSMSSLRSTVYGGGGGGNDDDDAMSTSSRSSSILTHKDDNGSQRKDRLFDEQKKQESRSVLRSRKLVMSVFVFATIACGSATYFFVKQTERDTFQLQVSGMLLFDCWQDFADR